MNGQRFAAAINCMDGRVQEPVAYWLKGRYGVQFVDVITEAGPVKLLAEEDPAGAKAIRQRLQLSLDRHGSTVVAVVGHHDCAANQASRVEQLTQIDRAVGLVRSWSAGVTVVGLYVNDLWQVELVTP